MCASYRARGNSMTHDQNRKEAHGWSRREFLRTAAGLAVVVLLPGCRRTAPSVLSMPTDAGWVETERYRKEPPWRVGRASRGDLSSWQLMLSAHIEYGITEKYRQYFGDYHSTSANWDPDKQILDIQSLLAENIDLLLLDALDAPAVAAGVRQAMDAGVPVIWVCSGVQNAPYVSWVATNEQERGARCADWLCQQIGGGHVMVLQSEPAPGDSRLWLDGLYSRLEACPHLDVHVVTSFWLPSAAKTAVSAALVQWPSIQGLIVNSGTAGQGAIEALTESGIEIPPIAGGDDCNGWLRAAKARNVHFLGFGGSARLGLRCVELAMDVLSGRAVPAFEEFPYQIFDETAIDRYYRPDLSDHFWAIHELPEPWIDRMFKVDAG
jgi:ribose transport system substrate-binding protein